MTDYRDLDRERMRFAMLVEGETITIQGTVRGPGKFEGEPTYALYYYDSIMAGCSDDIVDIGHCEDDDYGECGERVDVFNLTDFDRALFPALGDAIRLRLWEDDSGFVYVETHSRENEDEIRDRVAEIEQHAETMCQSVARELRESYPYLF